MNYQFKSPYGNSHYTLQIQYGTYQEGNTYMKLIDCADGFLFAIATVNLPGLTEGEVAIKNYSENEGVLYFLLENNIVEQPHRWINSGFVNIPVCRLK